MTHALIPYAVIWGIMALVVIGLAVYRNLVSSHEDDSLHVRDDEAQLVASQGMLAQKIGVIDRWGKTLTVLVFISGVILGGVYVYASWVENNAASTNLQILR
jgi:hypothetical protein